MSVDGAEVIEEAEVVGADLERYERPSAPANLFGVSEPTEVIERAEKAASALKDVLTKQQLTKRIGQTEHVLVSGWTLLGSMLGVFPVCVWTRKLEDGWEARVEARTRSGEVVGAAEAMCTHAESLWKNRDEYALRSMAQTRATSKALRQPLGFVVTLAGYADTPAEELPPEEPSAPHSPGRVETSRGSEGGITSAQHAKIGALLRECEEAQPTHEGQKSYVQEVRDLVGKSSRKDFTCEEASKAIEWLQEQLEAAKTPL